MLNDISICINYEYDTEMLCRDLAPKRLGLKQKSIHGEGFSIDGEDQGYVCFEGFVTDEVLNDIMTFVKASPYGNGYEILLWKDGNSIELW